MDKYVVFQIEGGIGKNVVATAVVRAISKSFSDRKIIIVTAYPDIWECNPKIFRIFQFGQISYFYEDFIDKKDTILFLQEPYRHQDYIFKRKHITQIWCELCGVEWDGEKPELYFTKLESNFVSTLINKDRPIFMIHPFGGSESQSHKYSWARDMPPFLAQDVVDQMSKDYRVIQIKREDQISLNNVEYISLNARQLSLSLLESDKRFFIDSYMQHAAASLGLSSNVLWIANSPKTLGYSIHNNIECDFEKGSLKNSMYEPYDILGNPIQLATPPNILFDSEQIIKLLK
jgi:hypothetical protein